MIRSKNLEILFSKYNHKELYEFLRSLFGITYVKTYSNCGCYIWFGGNRQDFNNNLDIDEYSPCAFVKSEDIIINNNINNNPVIIKGENVFVFLEHSEIEVINKFNRCQKLKAFL